MTSNCLNRSCEIKMKNLVDYKKIEVGAMQVVI